MKRSEQRLAPVVDLTEARRHRADARRRILKNANQVRARLDPGADPMRMRHIQRAVAVVRHWNVVDADTLRAAGFRPNRRPSMPSVSDRISNIGDAA